MVLARSDVPLTPVTLNASGSARATSFEWAVTRIRPDTAAVDLSALPAPQPPVVALALAPGEYLAALRVVGPSSQGAATAAAAGATAQLLVVVRANTQPVAGAGGPYVAYAGQPARVSAARSYDADGDALAFQWALAPAAPAGAPAIAEASASEAAFGPLPLGLYALTLRVDDGRGGVSAARADLTVLPAPSAGAAAGAAGTTSAAALSAAAAPAAAPAPPPVSSPAAPYTPPRLAPSPTPAPQPALYSSSSSGGGGGSSSTYMGAGGSSSSIISSGSTVPPAAPPQCLFERGTGVGVLAYDVLSMPAVTNLAAWARMEWRDCATGPVKPYGMTMATYLQSRGGGGITGGGATGGGFATDPAASALPPPAGALAAFIREPPAFVALPPGNATARVPLNATGSAAAPLRPIAVYAWVVARLPGGQQVAKAAGKAASVALPPGAYLVSLTVTDLAGQYANTSRAVAVGLSPVTAAVIGAPAAFVQIADGDATQFAMSANGSAAAPGRELAQFVFRVTSVPDGRIVANVAGFAGQLRLPTGAYTAALTVTDSGGGAATATKAFAVGASSDPGGRGAAGRWNETAVAAIGLPPPQVAQAAGSGLTRVAIDASGSAPAAGATFTTVLWAVVGMPLRTPAGSASGFVSSVVLQPGSYQVGWRGRVEGHDARGRRCHTPRLSKHAGMRRRPTSSCLAIQMQVGLLVTDSLGNTATVRKSFTIAPSAGDSGRPTGSGPLLPASAAAPAAGVRAAASAATAALPSGVSAAVNLPPVIKAGQVFAAQAGAGFALTGIADPDGDPVAVRWVLMEAATGRSTSGAGASVAVPADAAPGAYRLLISASDGHGGSSEGTAQVAVTAAPPPATAAAAAAAPPPPAPQVLTAAPSIYGRPLALQPRLPSRAFYQGAVLDVAAAASGLVDLSGASWQADLAEATCAWTLAPQRPQEQQLQGGTATGGGGAARSSGSGAGGGSASAAPASTGTATVYACAAPARFRLGTPGTFRLALALTLRGRTTTAASTITVTAKPFWSDFYTPASPQGFVGGRCAPAPGGPFVGAEFAPLSLACAGTLALPAGWGAEQGLDGARQPLAFAWKLTPLTRRAAAAHPQPLARAGPAGGSGSGSGGAAAFGAVAPGIYLTEVVAAAAAANAGGDGGSGAGGGGGDSGGGGGGGATSAVGGAYLLWTLTVVAPTARLPLQGPKPPVCASGAAATLKPAPLALLPGQSASPVAWSVALQDAPPAPPGGGSSSSSTTTTTAAAALQQGGTVTGVGASFSFVPLPGRYAATAAVDVADSAEAWGLPGARVVRRLTGALVVEALPCIECVRPGGPTAPSSPPPLPLPPQTAVAPIVLLTAGGACAPADADAARLLASRPAWLAAGAGTVGFAPGSDLSPGGPRSVTLLARAASNASVTARCVTPPGSVVVRDATPPTAAARRPGGECLAPANGLWACWAAANLVTARDNCGARQAPTLEARCGAAAAAAGACRVAGDGRVCLRAVVAPNDNSADAGGGGGSASASPTASPPTLQVLVAVRDGAGNALPAPVSVPVVVHAAARAGCTVPQRLPSPPAGGSNQ